MIELLTFENFAALVTLTALEIVLGIDNIVFLAVVTGKLPPEKQPWARRLGLILAMVMRIVLLLGISFIMKLTTPLFSVLAHEITGRDLVLLSGGLFLLGKATFEIHDKIEGAGTHAVKPPLSVSAAVVQILLLDMVFSLDSVITAVGMAREIWVMIVAVVLAMVVMLIFAKSVSEFVMRHPTIQMLAFSFLLLVGVLLVGEGLGKHIDRGYVYFAMAFSLFVEVLNIRVRRKDGPAAAAGD